MENLKTYQQEGKESILNTTIDKNLINSMTFESNKKPHYALAYSAKPNKFEGISREEILEKPIEELNYKIKMNMKRSTSDARYFSKRDFGSQPISIQKFLDE